MTANEQKVNVFSFDTQQRISDKEYYEFLQGGDYYDHDLYFPPRYNLALLNQSTYSASFHESSINFKVGVITSIFKKNRYLNVSQFNRFITDYMIYGTAYLNTVRSQMGNVLQLNHLMAHYMRVGRKDNFYFVHPNNYDNYREFSDNEVAVFANYDSIQNVSGRPSYLSALPSITLNKEATYFRIKYYKNGSHAGFILSINGEIEDSLFENIKKELQQTKGSGNFRNLVLNIPKGNEKSIQLIPISEVAAKDEFFNIKRVTDEDINTVHRVPPALLGVTPKNAGGFGKPSEHAAVFYQNEILPLQVLLDDFNDQLGVPAFQFNEYKISTE